MADEERYANTMEEAALYLVEGAGYVQGAGWEVQEITLLAQDGSGRITAEAHPYGGGTITYTLGVHEETSTHVLYGLGRRYETVSGDRELFLADCAMRVLLRDGETVSESA